MSLKRGLIFIILLLGVLFIVISIYSFNPYDPGIGVSGAQEVKNLGGLLGAYLASLFFFLFGFPVLFLPPILFFGVFAYFIGTPFKKFLKIFFLILIWLSLILSFIFQNAGIKSGYLFGKYPLNGGLIGELSSFLIYYLGLPGFFFLIISYLIFILLIGFGILENISTKMKGSLKLKKTLETEKHSYSLEPEKNLKEEEKKKIFPPPLELLNDFPKFSHHTRSEELKERALILISKLKEFGIEGEIVGINPGPVITVFEFKPAPGIKLSRIINLVDDLALGLSAKSVRIVAPIPGKDVVGIEISNPKRELVYLKEILQSQAFKNSNSPLTIALGKDISGNPVITDLRKLPHLLIAGSTGSGKSIFLHSVILSLIYKSTPEEVKFLMIDPKRIELSVYEGIPHLLHPVVLDPKTATKALRWLVNEMVHNLLFFFSKSFYMPQDMVPRRFSKILFL